MRNLLTFILFLSFASRGDSYERALQVVNKFQLKCQQFKNFWIKEVDIGEIGLLISLIPNVDQNNEKISYKCSKSKTDLEKDITRGYLEGVVGNFIITTPGDGEMFSIFNAQDQKKVFQDMGRKLKVENLYNDLRLEYERIYTAPCSIPQKGKECWNQIKEESKLSGSFKTLSSDCLKSYIEEEERHAQLKCQNKKDTENCKTKELESYKKYAHSNYTELSYKVEVPSVLDAKVQRKDSLLSCSPIP